MERTNACTKGHHHCFTFIYISDAIRVLNGSCQSISDMSLCGDVCGLSLHFLHHLCNMLNTILNASILLLSFRTPTPVISNLHPWPPFTSKVKEALWSFCLHFLHLQREGIVSPEWYMQKRSNTFIMKGWAFWGERSHPCSDVQRNAKASLLLTAVGRSPSNQLKITWNRRTRTTKAIYL